MARGVRAGVTRVVARVTLIGGTPLDPVTTAPGEAVDLPDDEAARLVAEGHAALPEPASEPVAEE